MDGCNKKNSSCIKRHVAKNMFYESLLKKDIYCWCFPRFLFSRWSRGQSVWGLVVRKLNENQFSWVQFPAQTASNKFSFSPFLALLGLMMFQPPRFEPTTSGARMKTAVSTLRKCHRFYLLVWLGRFVVLDCH